MLCVGTYRLTKRDKYIFERGKSVSFDNVFYNQSNERGHYDIFYLKKRKYWKFSYAIVIYQFIKTVIHPKLFLYQAVLL